MKREIEPLTSFRGIAAFMVVVYHLRQLNDNTFILDDYTLAFSRGYIWVDFFFILSGFILAYVYGSTFAGAFRRDDYLDFLHRRLRRIYPLHIATLLLFAPLVVSDLIGERAKGTPFDYTVNFVHNIFLSHSWIYYDGIMWNGPSWSISAEWAAYLLFPLFFFFICRLRMLLAGAFVGLGLVCLFIMMLFEPKQTLNIYANYYAVLRCFAGFCLGLLVHRVYEGLRERGGEPAIGRDRFCLAVLVLIPVLLHAPVYDIWLLPAFALVILATALNRGVTARVLGTPVLHGLGVISYSLYMTHSFVIHVALRLRDGLMSGGGAPDAAVVAGLMAAAVAATVALSIVTYRWVELPFRRGVRWPWRQPRRSVPARWASRAP